MYRAIGIIGITLIMSGMVNIAHADQLGTSIDAGTCLSPEKLKQKESAAEKNDLFAIRDLDLYYASCAGDRDKFYKYAKRAAEIGTAEDVNSYAGLVKNREGATSAFGWYLKAAQMGSSNAKLEVARAYRDGEGVKQNLDQAFVWFQLGATCQEFGVNDMEELAEFLWQHKPVPLSGPKALAWLTIANERIGLIPYYKTMRDDIRKTLSKEELEMTNHLASEFAQDAGCVDLNNTGAKK